MSQGRKAAERLAGKTVLITGASAGIGQATAIEFCDASNGNIKLVLAARRVERLETLKRKIEEEYPQARVFPAQLDISNAEAVQGFLEKVPEEFKDIDVLVNNAGIARGMGKVGEIDMEGVEAVFKTNVLGLIALTQAVLPIFKAKNSGDIINIGSIAGRDAVPTYSIYSSSKFAVKAFTSALLKELIDTKIRVVEIAPGFVRTEIVSAVTGNEQLGQVVYEGYEPLCPEDIGEAIVYASSRNRNAVVSEMVVMPTAQGLFSTYIRRGCFRRDMYVLAI